MFEDAREGATNKMQVGAMGRAKGREMGTEFVRERQGPSRLACSSAFYRNGERQTGMRAIYA
jgi:hypothetical protein